MGGRQEGAAESRISNESAAHCRFGKAGLGYIARIWGSYDGHGLHTPVARE